MNLNEIKGLGPRTISLLNKLNISNIDNLISYFPFRYDIIKRTDLTDSTIEKAITDGVVISTPTIFRFRKNKDRINFKMETQNKIIDVTIFNRGFLLPNLKVGSKITVIGKYDFRTSKLVANEIRFELLTSVPKIEPIYHVTNGLTSKQLNSLIKNNFNKAEINDYIPDYLIEKYNFLGKKTSVRELHQPLENEVLNQAIVRTKYEELFIFMLKMNYLKMNKFQIGLKREVAYDLVLNKIKTLPFSLTSDQLKSIDEIYNDLISEKRMNRLLQGDVGSGKTIVSFFSLFINYLGGYQGALMAPTEILAIQHFENIKNLFPELKSELLTGKLKVKEKKEIYQKLKNNEIDVIIGTHAIISEDVEFCNLGLVITDEQHRFGVNQRGHLRNKGYKPDILYMSATPIPRTYAITLFGDMDISSIKTMPSGRKETITYLKHEKEMKDVLELIFEQLKQGHQAYVIAPLIEESEKMDLSNVSELEQKFTLAFGKYYKIGVMHGKLSGKEKEEAMEKFKNNEIQILISTTVIEVGVDVKNATVMVVFDSYRFGLSALHQLRGRVGRNELQSYFVMISNFEKERLNVLTSTTDGFKISEEDFKLRGSGDMFGNKQSGDMCFSIVDLRKDYKILLKAKEDSEEFLNNYGNDLRYSNINRLIVDMENLS